MVTYTIITVKYDTISKLPAWLQYKDSAHNNHQR